MTLLEAPRMPFIGLNWRLPFGAPTRRAATGSDLLAAVADSTQQAQTGDMLFEALAPDFVSMAAAAVPEIVETVDHDLQLFSRWLEAVPSAARFAEEVADLVGMPEINIDPDGDVALDWFMRGGRLAVSINPSGGLVFALRIGDSFSAKGALPSISQGVAAVRDALAAGASSAKK